MLAIYDQSIIKLVITCCFLIVIATLQKKSHYLSKLSAPRRIHLSQFPELLARSFLQRNLKLSDLYDHQRKAIKSGLFLGKNLVVRTGTDTGKTDIAFICEFRSLLRGLVGVYLVPHKRLLVDKRWQLENFFMGTSASGGPQELAHIITISGEAKPSMKELQKHSKHLIIVATFEAFRAFYFEAQSRNYFHKRKWVGTVVVDESHMVFNKERGLRLETLIYKLKREQDPQFCLLSASMTKRQAEWWSKYLNTQLIYEPSKRVFNYEELTIQLYKRIGRISQDVDVKTVRSRGKYTHLERKKIDKVCERIKEQLSKYKGKMYY